jgi:hypothetical protein
MTRASHVAWMGGNDSRLQGFGGKT